MKRPPPSCRVLWEEAAARAGATEKMISRRLREALVSGDIPTARMMSASLRDVVVVIRQLEERALAFKEGQPWLNDIEMADIFSETTSSGA